MSNYHYSDLEVAPSKAPEVFLRDAPERAPEVVPHSAPEPLPYYYNQNKDDGATPSIPPKEKARVCGVKRRTFWVILGVALAIIIAAVAGGVAGALISRNGSSEGSSDQSTEADPSSDGSPSSTAPPPFLTTSGPLTTEPATTSTQSLSTTTVTLARTTLIRDCPSADGSLYDASYEDNEPLVFRKFCTAGLRHVLNGVDLINQPEQSLNDCINACVDYNIRNRTDIATGDNQPCNAVCWRSNEQLSNINQIPGQCFGYTTLNNSMGFQVTDEPLCDSAAWINQRDL
ncbi:hypothetical protein B0I35DRAFT_475508 [Stachybotrys elegans]|uniref:Uncharacterized protein n=1 Tax=Stachybotrys elegans TaxID=80388 RepID=A0A8K0T0A1_9HYPO|nr:hypothetical protein B0I35DRAFT_475508 [Stachybotrys elegans]